MNRERKYRAWDGISMYHSPALSEGAHHLASWFEAHSSLGFTGKESVFMDWSGMADNNGKDIYEGDIIQFAEKFFYVVKYEDAKFVGYHANNDWGKWGDLYKLGEPGFNKYNYVVIGNIYQNPELLTNPPLSKE